MVTSLSSSNNDLAGIIWKQLAQSDADGDGKLSKDELQAAMADTVAGTETGTAFDDVFTKIDSDGDGYITKDEFDGFLQSSKPDKDVMRGLVSAEVDKAVANMQQQLWQSLLSQNSSSGDIVAQNGLFSDSLLQEASSSTDSLFSQLDTNQDGTLSKEDFSNLGSTLLGQLQTYNNAAQSGSNLLNLLNTNT
ncbi:MAG: EF-hand domain-containing protein [Candidatus Margulisbacteria bacterium]|nr:EF-hand domain-containing protein [Candidatus Margulisiibacteriota bacterium]